MDDSKNHENPQSKGGKTRAERLTAEERKEIARQGAAARWQRLAIPEGTSLPKAIVNGVLPLGNIPCAVLDDEDNTRVLTQAGFAAALGRTRRPNSVPFSDSDNPVANLPAFLRARNLEPFISNDLIRSSSPIIFETERGGGFGGNKALGYKAQLLPDVCWVYQEAKIAGKILPSQEHIAEACTRLLKGLTNVAIDALVDEATGFQDIRTKNALAKLLEKYVSPEALPWVKTFDDEFYKEMFRLHGYAYDPSSVKRPMVFAKRTEDIYDRLAPGVRKELQRIVKRGANGRPSEKLFQHLTDEEGYQALSDHLKGIKAIMRASKNIEQYKELIQRSYPKVGSNLELTFPEDT